MDFLRRELLHTGKANNVFLTNLPGYLELESSDRISKLNGGVKGIVENKGIANNFISMECFKLLEKFGIPTHFVQKGTNDASKIVIKLFMAKLEVICRLFTEGSFCTRYGCDKMIPISPSGVEFCLKDDALNDPPIAEFAIAALNIATLDEIEYMRSTTIRISEILRDYFDELGITLVDFKLEYGRDKDGNIILGDEISPDTCRFKSKETGESLDKDVFRKNLGDVSETYAKLFKIVSDAAVK